MQLTEETLADGVRIFCGDCNALLPFMPKVDALVTDPPYGISKVIGKVKPTKASRWALPSAQSAWNETSYNWDDKAPDLTEWLELSKHAIVWGGNYFPLPPRRGWLIWDKMIRKFSSGHVEMAWTTLDQPTRAFNYSHGQLAHEKKKHPTQKPLPLMRWCIDFLPKGADEVLDPFMGSGTTGVAAVLAGKKFVGIERDLHFFQIARERILHALDQARLEAALA